MPRISEWTTSMTEAWQYALSAIERGMTATEGLADYRNGGGSIRTQSWYDLTGLARETRDTGDLVMGQPWETPIPGQAYSVVGYDYEKKYVVIAEVTYTDPTTGDPVKRSVTVESSEIRPWDEIESEIRDVTEKYGEIGSGVLAVIGKVDFLSPKWVQW